MAQSSFSTDSLISCFEYFWSPNVTNYTSSTSDFIIIMNSAGCDSNMYLELTINTVKTNVSISGNGLTAEEDSVTYQWGDCSVNYEIIFGETNQIFSPQNEGSFAVIMTENGCTDTSNCETFFTVDKIIFSKAKIVIYPNPVDQFVNVEISSKDGGSSHLTMFNSFGQKVRIHEATNGTNKINVTELPSGVYIGQVGMNDAS